MIFLVIIILVVCICCCSSSVLGLGTYNEKANSYMPLFMQFSKKPEHKFLGHTLRQIHDTTENNCRKECSENKYCIGATFKQKGGRCDLQYQNAQTKPKFLEPWDGHTYYEKVFTMSSNILETSPGYKIESVSESIPVNSQAECALACMGKSPAECKSANFWAGYSVTDEKTGKTGLLCELSTTNKKLDPQAYNEESGSVYFHRLGLPGFLCKKNEDCMFSSCSDGICLAGETKDTGEKCVYDYQCGSGKCSKLSIPMSEQEAERQKLLKANEKMATRCDVYKNQKACEETTIASGGISGADCQWREKACFPKTIKKSKYVCK